MFAGHNTVGSTLKKNVNREGTPIKANPETEIDQDFTDGNRRSFFLSV